MKALKNTSVLIVTLAVLFAFTSEASARRGHHGFHHGGHHSRSSFFFSGTFLWPGYHYYPYSYYPDYYVVPPPPVVVVRERPVVIERQVQVVQPQVYNESMDNTFKELRFKKSESIRMLEIGDKASRMKAIRELGGFTFDDKVRGLLEEVLLYDGDAELRVEAARALGELKNPDNLPALKKARVEDASQLVREAADESVKKIEGN